MKIISVTTPACPHCKKHSFVSVKEYDYNQWKAGIYVQDAFPYLDLETRELLKTGYHDSCWKAVFGNDD